MARGEPIRVLHDGFVPGRFAIDAYGRGGFRFAEMSHRGSILALPSGIFAWPVGTAAEITTDTLDKVVAERAAIDVLLLGTGPAPSRSMTPCAGFCAMPASASMSWQRAPRRAPTTSCSVKTAGSRPPCWRWSEPSWRFRPVPRR